MTVRVYLIASTPGKKPTKAFGYQIAAREKPNAAGSGTFIVDGTVIAKLHGK